MLRFKHGVIGAAIHGLFQSTAFDPESFANTTVTEVNDTKYTPVPEEESPAVIKSIKFRTEKDYLILDVQWAIDSQKAREVTGMKEPTVRQTLFLDRLENGTLDMGKGKNIKLGKLREATGLNTPGQPFNFNMLPGKAARVKVKHRMHEGDTFADVSDVTKL